MFSINTGYNGFDVKGKRFAVTWLEAVRYERVGAVL